MSVVCGLHWLTWTASQSVEELREVTGGNWSPRMGMGGYGHPQSITHDSGLRLFWGSKDPQQPRVFDASGETCDRCSADLIQLMVIVDGNLTRADVALMLGPDELARSRLMQMRRAYKAGQCVTKMDASKCIWLDNSDSQKQGATCYFGGRFSAFRLRGYTLRGPLRLEFQYRPEKQDGILLPGVLYREGCASLWRGLAQRCIFPFEWYRNLLLGDAYEIKGESTEAPSLANAIDAIKEQYGATLWAMKLLGVTDDILKEPVELTTNQLPKFTQWVKDAQACGFNGDALQAEIDRLSKKYKGK